MKIITTSDLHQWIPKWKDLISLCKKEKPDIVIIAGDLLPKNSFVLQMNFLAHMKKYCLQMKDAGVEVFLTLGNDDNQNACKFMEEEDKNGTWHYVHNKIVESKGFEFIGMSYVKDHPFGYKYWCRKEFKNDLGIEPTQLCEPLLLNEKHQTYVINDYKEFLNNQLSIFETLSLLGSQVKNLSKSIWIMHDPPFNSGLDQTARGPAVGSKAVLKFIEQFQPLMTVHGHIHESPEYTGVWYKQYDKTMAFQAGQITQKLFCVIIQIEDDKIVDYKHSYYN